MLLEDEVGKMCRRLKQELDFTEKPFKKKELSGLGHFWKMRLAKGVQD